jgi:hypothetical protein
MANKAKHAFGMLENIDSALSAGTIDAYDILFVKDADGKPYVGWVDKDGNKVIVQEDEKVIRVDALPTADGDENVVYIYNNEGYIWDGTQCIPISKSTDLTILETQVSELETQLETKVDVLTVETMIKEYSDFAIEVVEF